MEIVNQYSNMANVILGLVVVFQWFDRRSRSKALENTLHALRDMSARTGALSDKQAVRQKSEDLLSVIDGAIRTIDGSKRSSLVVGQVK